MVTKHISLLQTTVKAVGDDGNIKLVSDRFRRADKLSVPRLPCAAVAGTSRPSGQGPLECNGCRKRFERMSDIKAHKDDGTAYFFWCRVCGKAVTSKTAVSRHLAIHRTESDDVFCSRCGEPIRAIMDAGSHSEKVSRLMDELQRLSTYRSGEFSYFRFEADNGKKYSAVVHLRADPSPR